MSKILVLMSGGVDSSLVAKILKEEGHEIVGATMTILGKNMKSEMPQVSNVGCYSYDTKEDVETAKKLAQKLEIDFHIIDCSEPFEKIVLENFRNEYSKGHTPNPCIICNRFIKFGAFIEKIKQKNIDFDYIATGHYANIKNENGRFFLQKGVNHKKDQSYFLYRLTQSQLSKIIFPLGNFTKEETRKKAFEFGLEVFNKPDSQDFYNGDYNDILNFKAKEGNFITKNGQILGKHNGIHNYTIGQRKGIGLSAPFPLYVLELKEDTNEVVVGYKDETFKDKLIATNLVFGKIENLKNLIKAKAKIRSAQKDVGVIVNQIEKDKIEIKFVEPQSAITIGQSIVIYDENDCVLLGGIIEKAF